MTEEKLMKQIEHIIYKKNADQRLIDELLTTYRISKSQVSNTEEEVIIICAADVWRLTPEQVLEKSRSNNRPIAKHFICYYLRTEKSVTYQTISDLLKFNHHSCVIHGVKNIKNLLDVDKDIQKKYAKFKKLIKDRL